MLVKVFVLLGFITQILSETANNAQNILLSEVELLKLTIADTTKNMEKLSHAHEVLLEERAIDRSRLSTLENAYTESKEDIEYLLQERDIMAKRSADDEARILALEETVILTSKHVDTAFVKEPKPVTSNLQKRIIARYKSVNTPSLHSKGITQKLHSTSSNGIMKNSSETELKSRNKDKYMSYTYFEVLLEKTKQVDTAFKKVQNTLQEQNTLIEALDLKIHDVSSKFATIDTSAKENTSDNRGDCSRCLNSHQKRLLMSSSVHRVAFSSHLSTYAQELGLQQTVPFNIVDFNEGGAFDPVLHIFVCPVNGVYIFMSSLVSEIHDHIETDIVKDGTTLTVLYASGATSGHGYDQGFNSIVSSCNKGERVWVRVHSHQGTTVNNFGSSFSGYILWEI